ncbi:MAG: AtpZ/AtpI family protein [Filifactoraceae bacterium]
MKNSDYGKIIKGLSNITQFGLLLVIPILLCMFIAIYIRDRWKLGNGVVILGITIGLSAGMLNLFKIARHFIKEADAQKGKYDPVKLVNYDEEKDE